MLHLFDDHNLLDLTHNCLYIIGHQEINSKNHLKGVMISHRKIFSKSMRESLHVPNAGW